MREISKKVQARLDQLYDQHGMLTPQIVVEDAKNSRSPLHTQFNWNLKKAAEAHWLDVARDLIRTVRYEYSESEGTIKGVAYIRDIRLPTNQSGYRRVADIKSGSDEARDSLLSECQRLADIARRCRELGRILGVESEFEGILKQVGLAKEIIIIQRRRLGRPLPPPRPTNRGRRARQ